MDVKDFETILKEQGDVVVYKLEEWAEKTGDKKYFFYGEQNKSLTFKQFNEMANCIAHNYLSMGVKKGDRISLFLVNQLVTALAMFGMWKIGAVYCPINYNYRGKLLSYQINDTGPKLLITEQSKIPQLNHIKNDIPKLDIIVHKPKEGEHDYTPEAVKIELEPHFRQLTFESLLKGNTKNPGIDLRYDDIANIIYTSGTTGNPKGCVQTNRWMQNYNFYTLIMAHPDDVVYNDLPLYHVAGSILNIARAAWAGCGVACWDKFSPNDFWKRIEVSGATSAILIDIMIPWLMTPEEKPNDRFNTLKTVHMQPLVDYHHKFAKRFGIDFVTAGYGQTETGNGFVFMIEEALNEGEGTPKELRKGYTRKEAKGLAKQYNIRLMSRENKIKKGCMGQVSILMEAAVFDEDDKPLGAGKQGHLVFRGRLPHILFEGYFNKPEATAETFRNGWLHTGDGVYKDEDDIFYYVDRIGGFMRSKGENISSTQVEDIVNAHPKVQNSSVFPVPAEQGHEDDIVLYVVLKPGEELSEEMLRTWLKEEMPKYMWPRHIRFTDALPVTPTFKVEKFKLKEMFLKEKSVG